MAVNWHSVPADAPDTERLRSLPSIFRKDQLDYWFDWSHAKVDAFVKRCLRARLIRPIVPRSIAFFNLEVQPVPDRLASVVLVHPQAVMVGAAALHRKSWMAGLGTVPEFAVLGSTRIQQMPGMAFTSRSVDWMARTAAGQDLDPKGFKVLRPAWALADLVQRAGDARVQFPMPIESLDLARLPFDEAARADWAAAAKALKLNMDELTAAGLEAVFDRVRQRHAAASKPA